MMMLALIPPHCLGRVRGVFRPTVRGVCLQGIVKAVDHYRSSNMPSRVTSALRHDRHSWGWRRIPQTERINGATELRNRNSRETEAAVTT